jgi:hypothetical protein
MALLTELSERKKLMARAELQQVWKVQNAGLILELDERRRGGKMPAGFLTEPTTEVTSWREKPRAAAASSASVRLNAHFPNAAIPSNIPSSPAL